MRCSDFIAHLTDRNVRCVLRDGRLVAIGAATLPTWTRAAIATHRRELTRFLVENVDQELKPEATRRELKRLGFSFIPEVRQWIHPRGNEVGDAILLGLISPEDVEADMAERAKDLHAPPARPKAVPVQDLREIYPGRYRWSEHEGVLYEDPFPRLRSRITEY